MVYFFSLKHKCINGDHSRIIAAQSGSNNHPVGPCGWPCKLKIMLIRGTARRAGKSFEVVVRPLHQWPCVQPDLELRNYQVEPQS